MKENYYQLVLSIKKNQGLVFIEYICFFWMEFGYILSGNSCEDTFVRCVELFMIQGNQFVIFHDNASSLIHIFLDEYQIIFFFNLKLQCTILCQILSHDRVI